MSSSLSSDTVCSLNIIRAARWCIVAEINSLSLWAVCVGPMGLLRTCSLCRQGRGQARALDPAKELPRRLSGLSALFSPRAQPTGLQIASLTETCKTAGGTVAHTRDEDESHYSNCYDSHFDLVIEST